MPTARDARWMTAVHEAAHVVVARDSGLPVSWVSIDRRFLADHGLSVQHEGAFLADVDTPIRTIATRGAFISRDERALAEAFCAAMFAGGLAEVQYSTNVRPVNVMADRDQVSRLVLSIDSLRLKRKAWTAACQARAQETIDRRREDIERLADALHERSTIMGDEINMII